MTGCKSPTHEAYRNAEEALYLQAYLAQQDLTKALDEARAENPTAPYKPLAAFKQHVLDEAAERLAFGKSELEAATRAVNAHFDRGCRNLPKETPA